ncbi:hypothetical protein [Silvanigrella sp.]|jgi:hypothetical protein|uniref:hypothetical protein n=1 Tax=Silvanigrella sp. TaxID=2024976 RepID=UPI0037C7900F
MEKEKKGASDFVNVNLKLNLKDSDTNIANIAKLIREGSYVDDKKIIKLKGKDLVMYLLAARVQEQNKMLKEEPQKEIEAPLIINNSQDKLSKFGVKTPN